MRRIKVALALLGAAVPGASAAQTGALVAPAVTVQQVTAAPAPTEVARQVLIQPSRLEAAVAPGYTTALLSFTLLSEVPTEVYLRPADPRLVFRGAPEGKVILTPYTLHSVSFLALSAHSGAVDIFNAAGQRIAQAPYTVFPAKTVNQAAALNFSPLTGRTSVAYSVAPVPQGLRAPALSANVNLGYTPPDRVDGTVSLSVRW